MTSPLRAARAAFVFLTRIPVGGFPYSPAEWRWAPAYFPLVGAFVGALAGGVLEGLRPLGVTAAAYAALAVMLLVTGALHEDGLADTSDALGGGQQDRREGLCDPQGQPYRRIRRLRARRGRVVQGGRRSSRTRADGRWQG